MSFCRHLVSTSIAALVLTAPTLGAQEPPETQAHDGFNIGFGGGGAWFDVTCTGCAMTGDPSDPWKGGSGSEGYFRLGGALSQQVLLGGELSVRGTDPSSAAGRSSFIVQLLFTGQYYPSPSRGFHVAGGIGGVGLSLSTPGSAVEGQGVSARAGIGYDFALGRRFALTPYANVGRAVIHRGSIVTFGSQGAVVDLGVGLLTQIGLGFNWY
jgi:hypothetical protein